MERIEAVFLSSDSQSDVAFKAMLALEDLSDDVFPLVERLVNQYRSGHHKFAALKLALKTPEKLPKDAFWKMLPEDGRYDDIDERLLSYLAHREDTRQLAIERARAFLADKGARSLSSFLNTASVLDPQHPVDRERLWERSRWPRGPVYNKGGKAAAILRLAQSEPDAAYETALETLTSADDDRLDMPNVLLRLDPEKAVADLCKSLSCVRDKKMCRAIGISLRRHGKESDSLVPLKSALSDSEPRTRRSAAMVAGYLTEASFGAALQDVLRQEGNWAVCTELLLAMRTTQREAGAALLVDSLDTLQPEEVWGTIDCICNLVDPDLAAAQNDPIGLVAYLNRQGYALTRYTTKVLEKCVKEIEKDFDSLHNRWNRDEI